MDRVDFSLAQFQCPVRKATTLVFITLRTGKLEVQAITWLTTASGFSEVPLSLVFARPQRLAFLILLLSTVDLVCTLT